jgi:hypothetical protein
MAVAVTFFVALQQNQKEGDDNFVVTFFVACKKMKKKHKGRSLLHFWVPRGSRFRCFGAPSKRAAPLLLHSAPARLPFVDLLLTSRTCL